MSRGAHVTRNYVRPRAGFAKPRLLPSRHGTIKSMLKVTRSVVQKSFDDPQSEP